MGWEKHFGIQSAFVQEERGCAYNIPLLGSLFFSSSILVHMYVHSTIFEGTNGSRNVVCFRLSRPYDFRSPRKLNVNSSPCHDFCSEGKKFEAQIEANIGRELEKKFFIQKA